MKRPSSILIPLLLGAPALAQESNDERLDRLEQENAELRQQIDAIADEVERIDLGGVIPLLDEGFSGLGPASSKVYNADVGAVSIGGYGEMLFLDRSGGIDTADAQRGVVYVGTKFNEQWILNSEFEFEHGTTSASSGSTSSSGSASIEFAYIDYLRSDSVSFRGGLLLVPMGFISERHEPTTYLPALRPQTEQRIIPSTWREMGVGLFGSTSIGDYRLYTINGLNGSNFDANGLRGGRQKGNRAAADDMALTGRLDIPVTDALTLGGAFYIGDSANGMDAALGTSLGTQILELHGEYQSGPWNGRFLYAQADIDGAGAFNAATAENLADRLNGGYLEVGYDVLAGRDCGMALSPYLRYETIDTQASLPTGFSADPTRDSEILTVGLNFQPHPQVVLKLEANDWDEGTDNWAFLLGYIF